MSDLYEDEQHDQPTPEDLCRQAFSRCSNWPEDQLGQQGLFHGLYQASEQYQVTQEDLIARCREQSAFCPTDHDLMAIGAELFRLRADAREAARDRHAEWRAQYGSAQKVPVVGMTGKCTCGCDRGWKEIMGTSQDRQKALWDGLRAHFQPVKGQWPPYRDMAPMARKLGFEAEAQAWERCE
jgi:hypothetical protein